MDCNSNIEEDGPYIIIWAKLMGRSAGLYYPFPYICDGQVSLWRDGTLEVFLIFKTS